MRGSVWRRCIKSTYGLKLSHTNVRGFKNDDGLFAAKKKKRKEAWKVMEIPPNCTKILHMLSQDLMLKYFADIKRVDWWSEVVITTHEGNQKSKVLI